MDPYKQMNKSGLLRKISPLALAIVLFSLLPISQIAYSQEGDSIAPPAGLMSWWPGDGNANDIVAENHGILQNGASFGTGLVDQAFSLDGVDDYVMVPHHPSLNFGSNDFTVDLWVNFRTTEGEQVLIEKYIETEDPGTRVGWTLTKLEDNTMRFAGPGNWNLNLNFTPPSIPTNTWIHVAVTRNANTLTLYWNGESLGSYEVFDFNLDSPASLKFGHRGDPIDTPGSINGRGFYLAGLIDEVEIFNRALSDSEIKEIFYAGSAGKIKIIAQRMIKPIEGYLKSPYGWRNFEGKMQDHHGIDIVWLEPGEIYGKEFVAPVKGTVTDTGLDKCGEEWMKIYHGEVVRLDDTIASDVSTRYFHLKDSFKEAGNLVSKDMSIGEVGGLPCPDWSTAPHLHFGVYEGTESVNPIKYVEYFPIDEFRVESTSPVDIVIIDPNGLIISKQLIEIPEIVSYLEEDLNGDGVLDDRIWITDREMGDYLITIVPEPDALPADTYSLEVTAAGITIVLAEDVPISEIPRIPYIIQSTETEITPIISAFVDFDPDSLNLKSKGKYVTTYIELPVSYDINDIDLETVRLNGQIPIEPKPTEIGDYDDNGIPDLMIKFNRSAVQDILEVGDKVEIIITGEMIDESPFEGSDIIRVISQGK